MPQRPWKTLRQSTVQTNPWWRYGRDEFETADGHQGEYHFVSTPGSVMVVPLMGDGRVVMVSQYRYLGRRESLELPGGGLKPGLTPEEAAGAELAEETGLQAGLLERVGEFNPCNGIVDEMCQLFLARELSPVVASPDPTEDLRVEPLHPAQLEARIAGGSIWDGMTLAAWCLVRGRVSVG